MASWIFKENNLDLIRLLAALQVAILHTSQYLLPGETDAIFFKILALFPGVPVFFFISGYLISKSYEKAPSNFEYFKNRTLRIYPALIVCVFINIVMVWSTGYLGEVNADFGDVLLLFLGKATILQFYNPDFMRSFGDGVLNGSLWTICVELQFYFLTPFVYYFFAKNKQLKNAPLLILIAIFLIANRLLYFWLDTYSEEILWKLYRVSFAPWIYMFFVGILFQRNFETIANILSKVPGVLIFSLYVVAAALLPQFGFGLGNGISPVLYLLLSLVIFRFAYFMPRRITKVLGGNDISYGVYIWHMPVVNQMLYFNLKGDPWHVLAVLTISIVLAIASWKLVEKPCLRRKKFTIYK